MTPTSPDDLFSRHHLLPEIGRDGQAALLRSHVAIVGVGAVGSRTAELLCRAGVGRLTLIDHDYVEFSNLPRQTLYTWLDAEQGMPKAEAARRQLNGIMPTCQVFAYVGDLNEDNIDSLLAGADAVADGTDNIETRYLINDWCVEHEIPWVYAGAVGMKASVFPVLGKDRSLRTAFPEPPPAESLPTATQAGVLAATTAMAASRASTLILRILLGDPPDSVWETWDVWNGTISRLSLDYLKKSQKSD
jgi:molybdopterin/thiamine biosynthesis adenylyltransferase